MVATCILAGTPLAIAAQEPHDGTASRLSVGIGMTYFPSYFGAGDQLGFQATSRFGPAKGSGVEIAYTFVPGSSGPFSRRLHGARAMYSYGGTLSQGSRFSYDLGLGASATWTVGTYWTVCQTGVCHGTYPQTRFGPTLGADLGFALSRRLELAATSRVHYSLGGVWSMGSSRFMPEFGGALRYRF